MSIAMAVPITMMRIPAPRKGCDYNYQKVVYTSSDHSFSVVFVLLLVSKMLGATTSNGKIAVAKRFSLVSVWEVKRRLVWMGERESLALVVGVASQPVVVGLGKLAPFFSSDLPFLDGFFRYSAESSSQIF